MENKNQTTEIKTQITNSSKSKFVCTNCGNIGNRILKTKGSGFLEIMLYLFLISFPIALIYSIWRRTNQELICSKCKQPTLIPIDSPNGQKILAGYK